MSTPTPELVSDRYTAPDLRFLLTVTSERRALLTSAILTDDLILDAIRIRRDRLPNPSD